MILGNYKTISYIIPAYNMEKYIRYCITSIFEQRYEKRKIEIIVVNDASTDTTLKVAQDTFDNLYDKEGGECVGNYQIIDLKENHGPGFVLNKGFGIANGDYLCFLSADDHLIDKEKTRTQSIIMELYNPDISYFSHVMTGSDDGTKKLSLKSNYKIIKGSFIPFISNNNLVLKNNYLLFLMIYLKRNPINSSTFMINKESYFKFGEWDPSLRADCDGDMLLNYSLHGAKIMELDEMITPIFYRIHSDQVSNQSELMEKSINYSRLKYRDEVINGNYPLWLKIAMKVLK